jgi:hypothetical protein
MSSSVGCTGAVRSGSGALLGGGLVGLDGRGVGRRGGLGLERLGVDRAGLDLAHLDLLEGDRQGLARHGGHLRRDDLAESLAELVVVVVDLAGPHRGERHEGELRADAVEQALHPRFHEVGAPFGHRDHSITWGKCAKCQVTGHRDGPGG